MAQYRTTLVMYDGTIVPVDNQIEGKYGAVCVYLNGETALAVGLHPSTGNWAGLIASRGISGRYDATSLVDQIPVELRDGVVYATVPGIGVVQIKEMES
jgi:hypothetical protein